MISVLLFDVGDTLLDASSGQQDALQEAHRTAFAKFGFELSAGEYQQLDHEKMLQFVPSAMHAITWHFARPDVCLFNEIIEEVRSHYPQIRALGFRLHPGIAAVLEQLAGESGEYTLALAGNAPADITEVLDDLGVLRWFRHREVSGSIGVKKPDERFFRGGRDVDDPAVAALDHVRGERLAEEEGALDVYVVVAVPFLAGEVGERGTDDAAEVAGVVDENVDGAEALDRL